MIRPMWMDSAPLPPRPARRRAPGASITRLSLLGEITVESAIPLFKAIKGAGPNTIVLEIASVGGNATCAVALYELLILHPRRVVADVIGTASSAAGLVAMGADRRRIVPHGTFMLHKTTAGSASGRRHFDAVALAILTAATGQPPDLIDLWEHAETTFTADEAVKAGLAHEVVALTRGGGGESINCQGGRDP